MVIAAEKDLVYTKAQIKVLYHQVRLTTTTDEQRTLQLQIQELEQLQRRQRIFDVEDRLGKARPIDHNTGEEDGSKIRSRSSLHDSMVGFVRCHQFETNYRQKKVN